MKKCPNGHYYNEALPYCPYCSPGDIDELEKTELPDNEKTIPPFEDASSNNDYNEKVQESTLENYVKDDFFKNLNKESVGDKTIIIEENDIDDEVPYSSVRINRKLVGWLVSYTLDELGVDYRLYEGKNVIGSRPECEVAILQDKSISGKHATILFRNNKFLIKDEFSTNGTYINGVIIEEDTPQLHDGDMIKVGNTIFKFKEAL